MIAKKKMMARFDCEDIGPLKDYIGSKIDIFRAEGYMHITQLVLLQILNDEFELPGGKTPVTPATLGSLEVKEGQVKPMMQEMQTEYRKGVGKLLYLMRHSKPTISHQTR